MKSQSQPVAEVCLYGTRDTGFAYLASRPGLSSPIAAEGGWSAGDETRPSGRYHSLTEIIESAKADLRALGIHRGQVLVCFPGGEQCAHTPVETFQSAGRMALEPAPAIVVTAEAIKNAARGIESAAPEIGASSRPASSKRSLAAPLGTTSSGKPVPHVPARLGKLEKAASAAAGAHGLFDAKARPAIHAARSAQRAHFESYALDFTIEDHREAAKLIGDHARGGDRYLRYAHNGLVTLHERAIEAANERGREEALRR